MRSKKTGQTIPTFPEQVRFNGGYHDGAADRLNRIRRERGAGERPLPAWDPAYCDGYEAGWADQAAGRYEGWSAAAAWEARQAARRAEREARRALRAARPEGKVVRV